jgi:hypothetical protein
MDLINNNINGHIYIIKVRENIRLKDNVFKVGRTKDILKRIKQYPKGSKLIYTIYTDKIIDKENAILDKLKIYVDKSFGNEYINCDLKIIKDTIDSIVNIVNFEENYNQDIINEPIPQELVVIKKTKEEESQEIKLKVQEFYDNVILKDNYKIYKLYEIHRIFHNWSNNQYNITTYSLSRLLKDLGGKVSTSRVNKDETTKIINFQYLYDKQQEQLKQEEENEKNKNIILHWCERRIEYSVNEKIKVDHLKDMLNKKTNSNFSSKEILDVLIKKYNLVTRISKGYLCIRDYKYNLDNLFKTDISIINNDKQNILSGKSILFYESNEI